VPDVLEEPVEVSSEVDPDVDIDVVEFVVEDASLLPLSPVEALVVDVAVSVLPSLVEGSPVEFVLSEVVDRVSVRIP